MTWGNPILIAVGVGERQTKTDTSGYADPQIGKEGQRNIGEDAMLANVEAYS